MRFGRLQERIGSHTDGNNMVPAPSILLVPFAADAAGANITFPIPVDPTVTPGQASLSLGFPPVTMVDPVSAAGVPPYGQDFNGIFKMITAYLVWLQGGGGFYFDQDFSDEYGGYARLRVAVGHGQDAVLDQHRRRQHDGPGRRFRRELDSGRKWSRPLEPDRRRRHDAQLQPTGWGPSVDVLDIDASMGNATITGLKAGYNGQRVVVTNVGTSVLTLAALGSSLPANQFRLPTDYTLLQYMSLQLQYSTGAGLWIAIP
jgi:hypothetical protein